MTVLKTQRRILRSDPVDLENGSLIDSRTDLLLGGLIPFAVVCSYDSSSKLTTPAGHKIISTLDVFLEKTEENKLRYHTANGFSFEFERPTPGPGLWMAAEGQPDMQLLAGEKRSYHLKEGELTSHFVKFSDGKWRPAAVSDIAGNSILITYDEQHRPAKLAFPEGLKIEFTYNTRGFRESLTLVSQQETRELFASYAYDDKGNLLSVSRAYDSDLHYQYDDEGRRINWADSHDSHGRHIYDDRGRVIKVETNGPHNGDVFEYDDENNTTRFLPGGDPAKAETITFDDEGNVLEEIDALGGVTVKKYTRLSLEAETTNAEDETTSFGYDSLGNLISVTDAEGRENNVIYDQHSRPDLIMDPEGNAWRYEYDLTGGVCTIIDPLEQRLDIVNNDHGQPQSMMRHDGYIEQRAYDGYHQLITIADFNSGQTHLQRDEFGRVISATDPAGEVTRYEYQIPKGQDFFSPSKIIRSDGAELSSRYIEDKQQTKTIDGEGRVVVYKYGPFDLLEELTDPAGGTLKFSYDGQERLEKVTNQQDLEWSFERDGAGRVIRESDFDDLVSLYKYDRAGRIIRRTTADGSFSHYEYDKSGLLVKSEIYEKDTKEPEETVLYEYDENGLLCSAKNAVSKTEFTHDAMGRIISETQNGRQIFHTFDCCGNRIQRQIGEQVVSSIYDPLGGLSELFIDNHEPLKFSRNSIGQELERVSARGFSLRQEWDGLGQLTRQNAGRTVAKGLAGAIDMQQAGGVDAMRPVERHYSWSRAFEPTAISDSRWGGLSYSYDDNGQITRSQFGDGGAEKFAYDAALNIAATGGDTPSDTGAADGPVTAYTQRRTNPGGSTPDTAKFLNWRSSKGGRVEEARGAKGERILLTYDARSRVVQRRVERDGFRPKIWHYEWSGEDRLTACITPLGDRWTYGYDPFGRRLFKQHHILAANSNGGSSLKPAGRTEFLWDGDVLAEERVVTPEGKETRRTEWFYEPESFVPLAKREAGGGAGVATKGSDGGAEEVGGAGVATKGSDGGAEEAGGAGVATKGSDGGAEEAGGAGVATKGSDGGAEEVRLWYIVTDHLGTPREMLSEDGSLVWAAEYTTWGSIRRLWQADNDDNPDGNFQGMGPDGNPVYSTRVYGTSGNTALKPAQTPDAYACPIRFQGQWADEETGLYYNRFRYYDPDAAQYMSPDPIGIWGGYKPFSYVLQPSSQYDPLGLANKANVFNNVLCLYNKFPVGPQSDEFEAFIELWDEIAQNTPGGLTRRAMTKDLTKQANKFRKRAKNELKCCGRGDLAPGHTPDTGWGGAADPGEAWVPLDPKVNGYIGSIANGVRPGTNYTSVKSTRTLGGC